MKKTYNQSQAIKERPPRFNAVFWEVPLEQEAFNRLSNEKGLYYEPPQEAQERVAWSRRAAALKPLLQRLIEETLTQRQRQVVGLYFMEGKTEEEIGRRLGVSAATVSQHLFGKLRSGRRVGGAIPKLRRALARAGVSG